MGAGSVGFWQTAGEAAVGQRENPQRADAPETEGRRREPANVADFQELARAALPAAIYEYVTTGSMDEITLRENVAAFQRLRILPPLLTGVSEVDASTTVLKQEIAMPILLAPVAGQRLYHPQGGLASARAAAAAKTLFGVSSSIGHSVEEIAAASRGPKWFQLYVPKDRAVARKLVERVERAGYQAIIVTVDLGEKKDADLRNRFQVPREMLLKHLVDIGFDVNERMNNEELQEFNIRAWDLTLSWKVFDWLRSITRLPLLVKGVLRAEDAQKAVEIGLEGIVVSNHGGRRLDGVPASIEQLPHIVRAVDGRAEVFLDSGIRRGTDVFKALALGARAVLIGRAYAWALAADGEAGVKSVVNLLHDELVSTMLAAGCAKVGDINRSLLVA
jgi:isopentenyl diphosphate isomerase/L-lactate dehydrogenase-like FMN-dependent dehydrogenase